MNRKVYFIMTAAMVFALPGCVTQSQADAKMVKGCTAVIDHLKTPHVVKTVTATSAADETVLGDTYRRITVKYKEGGEAIDMDREASCLFSQQWGPVKASHMAVFQQVKAGDLLLGRADDGDTKGGLEQFSELVDVANEAMGQ